MIMYQQTMTSKTTSGQNDDNLKIYRSRTIPQQIHFPHKRKSVRRHTTLIERGSDLKQMVFLPDAIKNKTTIQDSEEETENESPEQNTPVPENTLATIKGEKRRSHHVLKEDGRENDTPTSGQKQGAKAMTRKQKRQKVNLQVELVEHEAETVKGPKVAARGKSSRQSTMTQMLHGRLPPSDSEELTYKLLEPRFHGKSRSKKKQDAKQRTLTQMVPTMRSFQNISEDESEETKEDLEGLQEESQEYHDVVTQRLMSQGLLRTQSRDQVQNNLKRVEQNGDHHTSETLQETSDKLIPWTEQITEEESQGDENFKPTQYIDTPLCKRRITPARRWRGRIQEDQTDITLPTKSSSAKEAEFDPLFTSTKQQAQMIPSSQSPPDSPLLMSASIWRALRSSEKAGAENQISVPGTLSKLRVVGATENKRAAVAPNLAIFSTIIPDSEDEEEDFLDEADICRDDSAMNHAEASTQPKADSHHGKDVGPETQAVLQQIDRACASNEDNHEDDEHQSSSPPPNREVLGTNEGEISLGDHEPLMVSNSHGQFSVGEPPAARDNSSVVESFIDAAMLGYHAKEGILALSPEVQQNYPTPKPLDSWESSSRDNIQSTTPKDLYAPETFPSTPMELPDDSSDEEVEVLDLTDVHTQALKKMLAPKATRTNGPSSVDLDMESLPLPQTTSGDPESQNALSNQSEQQTQFEWLFYSQYTNAPPRHSSNMAVAQDTLGFDSSVPHHCSPNQTRKGSDAYLSQATTADEVTPRKPKSQRKPGATKTPTHVHALSSRDWSISPSKLPPLLIPSSFPDPSQAALENWTALEWMQDSSGNRDGLCEGGMLDASVETFSVPGLPPLFDDADDDG